MSKDRTDYLLNVEEVLGPKLMKKLPRFVVNFFKKRIHQDEINNCIMTAEHYCGAGFFGEALKYLDITYKVRGQENLDLNGKKYLFACNHPLGGPEALIIGSLFHEVYGAEFIAMTNPFLRHMKPLAEFFVQVNNLTSKQSRDLGAKVAGMFESDSQVLIFPAGLCAREIDGKVTELPWKKTFITQARKYERDIVPLHISGYNSKKFFFLCKLSKFLGLKINIGMLYLVDELFNKRGEEFVITIGEPIPYSRFDRSKTDLQWAAEVKDIVKELSEGNGCLPNM